ncbi:MAG: TonB-dependent receptor plug domain-containing protein [Pseudomonadota bacterium]
MAAAFALPAGAAMAQQPPSEASDSRVLQSLRRLSLEELANVPVTTVLRRPVSVGEAPAAVYVIGSDDIRRSGVESLPEALRLAPNLDVARVDAVSYAISARGFGGVPSAANKILASVDGRSVYSPLFSGVFWHETNLPLVNIDRIEVISGPGGTLWGANAFNGVVNVITKPASRTQGFLAEARGGSLDQHALLQYGGRLGEYGSFRIYGMGLRREHSLSPSGADNPDRWTSGQAGFRFDWEAPRDTVTVQGDAYNTTVDRGDHNRGRNVLARWRRVFADDSTLLVRGYWDDRPSSGQGVVYDVTTRDVLAQYNRAMGAHQLVAGVGYRHISDRYEPTTASPPFRLSPARAKIDIANIFIQDTIALSPGLELTLGVKYEDSSYTGGDVLPNARLGWRVADGHYLWGAVSRATRTASRFDRDFVIAPVLIGGPDFRAERLTAYEVGYRGRPTDRTTLSVSLYYNDYSDLRSVELTNGGLPAFIGNGVEGETWGVEAWGDYQPTSWLTLSASIAAQDFSFGVEPGRVDLSGLQSVGDPARVQGALRSRIDLGRSLSLDLRLRGVGARRTPRVPAYAEADAALNWRITPKVEFQLVGANLLHDSHPEGVLSGARNRIRRSVAANLRVNF